MKQLTCEMCGSTELVKQDGFFVCQTCGIKYSIEEARKMMFEGEGDGVPATSIAQVDNTDKIKNYYELAEDAYNAGNNSEAENYCDKIIELDFKNYQTWLLKGKAVGWQSTLQNFRILESVTAFTKAINNAPEDEKDFVIEETKNQIISLSKALISRRGELFAELPNTNNTNGFISDLTSIFNGLAEFIEQTGTTIDLLDMLSPIAVTINNSVTKAWKDVIWPDYNGDPNDYDDRASKYEWQQFVERVDNCILIVEKAIDITKDDEGNIQRYNNLIFLQEEVIKSCSWTYTFSAYSTNKIWSKEWSLTDGAKNARRQEISRYRAGIKKIQEAVENKKKEEAERLEKERIERIMAYWEEHKEERAILDKELEESKAKVEELDAKIIELNQSKATVPSMPLVIEKQKEIESCEKAKASLGLFKGKEKKALQEKINGLKKEKILIQDKVTLERKEIDNIIKPIKEEKDKLEIRINEITSEITKDRGTEDDD